MWCSLLPIQSKPHSSANTLASMPARKMRTPSSGSNCLLATGQSWSALATPV